MRKSNTVLCLYLLMYDDLVDVVELVPILIGHVHIVEWHNDDR